MNVTDRLGEVVVFLLCYVTDYRTFFSCVVSRDWVERTCVRFEVGVWCSVLVKRRVHVGMNR